MSEGKKSNEELMVSYQKLWNVCCPVRNKMENNSSDAREMSKERIIITMMGMVMMMALEMCMKIYLIELIERFQFGNGCKSRPLLTVIQRLIK